MQIARPHTRFFRLAYSSPKQSDILSGIDIRIHIVSAISALKGLVLSCADMMALGTGLGSICRVNDNQRDSSHLCLVFKECSQLVEAPGIKFFSECSVPALGSGAYFGKALDGNAYSSEFGFRYNLLGNGMVDYRCSGSFFPFKPFQKSGTATLAFVRAPFRAFGLDRTTDVPLFVPVPVKRPGSVGFSFGCTGYICNAKVYSNKFFHIVYVFFGNFHRLEKEEFTFFEDKVCFPLYVRKIIGVVAYKRHFLTFADRPDGNRTSGVGKYPAVIADTSKLLEITLCLSVKFIRIGNFADTAHNDLRGKVESVPDMVVAQVVKPELVKDLVLPCNLGNKIACGIGFLECLKKTAMLQIGWNKLYFQSQLHNTKIQKLFHVSNV